MHSEKDVHQITTSLLVDPKVATMRFQFTEDPTAYLIMYLHPLNLIHLQFLGMIILPNSGSYK